MSDWSGSYWNHRVMKTVTDVETSYGVHEVYYDHNGTVRSWTFDPVEPVGETVDELQIELLRMLAACDRPVLDASDGSEL